MKKILVIFALTLVVVSLMAGCQSKESSSKVSETGVDKGQSSDPLIIYSIIESHLQESEEAFFKKFTEETGIEIDYVSINYADIDAKLTMAVSGGGGPAITGGTEKQTTVFSEYFIPFKVDKSKIFPRFYYNSDGEVISLPTEITAAGMWINKDLGDKYGVNYPKKDDESWTWDEFEAEMEKLNGQIDVVYPLVHDGSAHRFIPMIYQHGGLAYGEGYNDLAWNNEGAIKAMERLKGMQDKGILDPMSYGGGTSPDQLFLSGKYFAHISGSWQTKKYIDNASFEFALVPLPTDIGGSATIMGGSSYHAMKGSGMEEEAIKFMEWLANPDNLVKYAEATTHLSAVIGEEIDYGDVTEFYNTFSKELQKTDVKYVDDAADFMLIPGATSYTLDEIINILGGNKTIQEGFDDAVKALEESAKEAGLLD